MKTDPRQMLRPRWLPFAVVLIAFPAAPTVHAESLDDCLADQPLHRIARVVDPTGAIVFALVTASEGGHVTRARSLAPDGTPLRQVVDRAKREGASGREFAVDDARVCSVVSLPEADLDAETRVIVSTGLNYAAHAEEAGGGDVFLFPKPSAPTRPYAPVHPPAGVSLLDYEIELAFVLLEDVDPHAPPPPEVLLEKSAFFLSNDVSDREPIVANASLGGVSTGFPEAKGQPGFFPAGPWMVHGLELAEALETCSAEGLGLRLWVDDESEPRQDASTQRMILQPPELVARIGTWMDEHGRRSVMPFTRPDGSEPRFYPFAVPEKAPVLTAGSIVQTGTPEGVAMNAPSPLGVTLRGAIRFRSPFQQFLVEEKERLAAGETNYLVPGSVVRARIDGLGEQVFRIGEAGGSPTPSPCDENEGATR